MIKRRVIIDTDPGIDDAAAIAIALFSEEIDVRLITTVCGNVSLEKVTANTLKLLNFFDKSIPVAMGAKEPLIEELVDASGVHGPTGLEGYDFDEVNYDLLLSIPAIQAIHDEIVSYDGLTTIVAIGPLTNIAILLKVYPSIIRKIEEIVIMGGSMTRGNRTVMAEFNAATDPEAARIVMQSDLKKTLCTLDIGLEALVLPEDSQKMKDYNKTGDMLYQLFQKYRGGSMKTGLKMYDSTAIAYLLKPEMYEMKNLTVEVETKSEFSNGITHIDIRGYRGKEPNCNVLLNVNQMMFREWFLDSIKKCI